MTKSETERLLEMIFSENPFEYWQDVATCDVFVVEFDDRDTMDVLCYCGPIPEGEVTRDRLKRKRQHPTWGTPWTVPGWIVRWDAYAAGGKLESLHPGDVGLADLRGFLKGKRRLEPPS